MPKKEKRKTFNLHNQTIFPFQVINIFSIITHKLSFLIILIIFFRFFVM